jgi:small-conductance mechanosensitive channel
MLKTIAIHVMLGGEALGVDFSIDTRWILPLILVVGGIPAGLITEKIILLKLKRMASKTKWEADDVIFKSLRGATTLWFVIAGVYLAIQAVPMSGNFKETSKPIFEVIAILSVTLVLARVSAGFINLYSEKAQGVLPSTSIFTNLAYALIFIIGGLITLSSLGVEITPILTALGVGGLAVALALQETLSNLFSGLHIIASRQVRPGDYVMLDSGVEGHVTDISWRNTTIRALPNNIVVIPNSKLASAVVTNYDLIEKQMSVLVQVGVSYDSDLERVEEVTVDVARETMREVEGGVPEHEPFIRYHTFGDSSINFTVILRAREFVDQYPVKHEFIKRLHKRYKEEGIEIPFPIRTVYMKQE